MKQGLFEIKENTKIARDVYRMTLMGDISHISAPGQFINIKLDGFYLRRPISVYDTDEGESTVSIIYKAVGAGTEYMSTLTEGRLDVLTGLGNGFDTREAGEHPVVIGGGVGAPPMYSVAKKLISEGKQVSAVIGFGRRDEVFLREELEALGVETAVTTADGSEGIKGFVTDALRGKDYSCYFACGPEPMLRAVYDLLPCGGQLSFEERMGCGFGACMGCSCKTKYGNKRICKDGPVLKKEEVIW